MCRMLLQATHYSAFISRIFFEIGMLWRFHGPMFCSDAPIACPLFNLIQNSVVHSVIRDPRYGNISTCSSCSLHDSRVKMSTYTTAKSWWHFFWTGSTSNSMFRSLSCIVCKINNDDDDKSTIQYDTIPHMSGCNPRSCARELVEAGFEESCRLLLK